MKGPLLLTVALLAGCDESGICGGGAMCGSTGSGTTCACFAPARVTLIPKPGDPTSVRVRCECSLGERDGGRP